MRRFALVAVVAATLAALGAAGASQSLALELEQGVGAKKRCKIVKKRIRGETRNVRVCVRAKPRPRPGPVGGDTPAVTSTAELSLEASDSPDPVAVGADLAYTLAVRNNGPAAAQAPRVSIAVSAPVSFVSVRGGPFTAPTRSSGCRLGPSATTAPASCTLDVLAAGATWNLRFVAKPSLPGLLTATVSVTAATRDPSPANTTATLITTVIPRP